MFTTRTVHTEAGDLRAATLGAGPDLLVLHTLRNQLEYAQAIAPGLAERFTVHLVDLPGHGESARDLSRPFDADRFFDDVQAFIEAESLDDLTLIGESIGATTALAMGARLPERLRAIVAFNPHDGVPMLGGALGVVLSRLGGLTALPWRMENRAILRRVLSAAFADPSHLSDDYLDLLADAGDHSDYAAVMKSVMAHQRSWPAARETYGRIPDSLSVTVAYGDHDWAAPAHREETARLIPSVGGYVTMADTGHWSFLDNPERVVEIVLEAT